MTTCRDIVRASLKQLNYFASDGEPDAQDQSDALLALNRMLAGFALDGLVLSYPAGKNWREQWVTGTTYAASSPGDAVMNGGQVYTCLADNTASIDDEPGRSPKWTTYWTLIPLAVLTLASTFPLDAADEEGVIDVLSIRLASSFGAKADDDLRRRASDGWSRLQAKYMRTPDSVFDAALTRTPARRFYGTASSIDNM